MYINITIFFDVKLDNMLDKYQCFAGNFYFFLHKRKITCPEKAGSKLLPLYKNRV
jgi:hypothetical protein